MYVAVHICTSCNVWFSSFVSRLLGETEVPDLSKKVRETISSNLALSDPNQMTEKPKMKMRSISNWPVIFVFKSLVVSEVSELYTIRSVAS